MYGGGIAFGAYTYFHRDGDPLADNKYTWLALVLVFLGGFGLLYLFQTLG